MFDKNPVNFKEIEKNYWKLKKFEGSNTKIIEILVNHGVRIFLHVLKKINLFLSHSKPQIFTLFLTLVKN